MELEVALVNVALTILLAFVVEILVEHLVGKPLEQAAPMFPRWWLIYVSLVGGAALGWFSEVNIFEGLIPVLVGRIVTSILIGGGSQIVHAVVNKARDPFANL